MSISKTLQFSAADGVKVAASSYGSKLDPVVIMLHGAGQTRHSWHRSAASVANVGFQVITLDTRGHGDSDWSESGDYSLDTLILDLTLVVSQLGKPVQALVGASLGGMTALLAHGESDEKLCGALVLVDITPSVDDRGVARILEFMNRFTGGFASVDEAVKAVAEYKGVHAAKAPHSHRGLLKNLRQHTDGRYYWHWDPALLDHVSRFGNEVVERQQIAAGRLSLPVLLVRGKLSEVVSAADAEAFLKLVPHAHYADVAKASHMLATDNNDVFANALIGFLKNSDLSRQ